MADKLFCGRPFKGKFENQEIISLSCDDLNKLHANLNAETGKVHLVANTNQKGVRYTEIDLWYRDNGREKKEEVKTPQKPASPPVSQYSEKDYPDNMSSGDESDIPF